MRTTGTFQDVYDSAKSYHLDTAGDGRPINPVVRREGEVWMLESGLHSSDCDVEASLEAFDLWFLESYGYSDYSPSESDASDFADAHKIEVEEE